MGSGNGWFTTAEEDCHGCEAPDVEVEVFVSLSGVETRRHPECGAEWEVEFDLEVEDD